MPSYTLRLGLESSFRSLDINAGTLGLTALAIGDGPVHNLGLECVVDADKILAGHLAEGFLVAADWPKATVEPATKVAATTAITRRCKYILISFRSFLIFTNAKNWRQRAPAIARPQLIVTIENRVLAAVVVATNRGQRDL